MKHLTIDKDIVKSLDVETVRKWLEDHHINVMWVTLEQTIDFSDDTVVYTQYRHTPDGAIVMDKTRSITEQVPHFDRITHHCSIACRDTSAALAEDLDDYEVKDDSEPAAD